VAKSGALSGGECRLFCNGRAVFASPQGTAFRLLHRIAFASEKLALPEGFLGRIEGDTVKGYVLLVSASFTRCAIPRAGTHRQMASAGQCHDAGVVLQTGGPVDVFPIDGDVEWMLLIGRQGDGGPTRQWYHHDRRTTVIGPADARAIDGDVRRTVARRKDKR
jgi:hypothetical protein